GSCQRSLARSGAAKACTGSQRDPGMSAALIGFAGMTHLGLVSCAAAAAHGFEVVAWDPDAATIDALENGRWPVVEPDLPRLIAENRARLSFTAAASALARCDVV